LRRSASVGCGRFGGETSKKWGYAWEREREMKGELLRSSLKLKMYLFYVINISTSTKTS